MILVTGKSDHHSTDIQKKHPGGIMWQRCRKGNGVFEGKKDARLDHLHLRSPIQSWGGESAFLHEEL